MPKFSVFALDITIFYYLIDAGANATLFADAEDGLDDPSCMAFVTVGSSCDPDIEPDGDVDGADLADFVALFDSGCLADFARAFGSGS